MPPFRKLLVFIGDCAMLAGSFYLMLFIRFGAIQADVVAVHKTPFLVLFGIWILLLYVFDMYEPKFLNVSIFSLRHIAIVLATQTIAGFSLFYLIPSFGISPKTNLLLTVAIFGVLFIIWRQILAQRIGIIRSTDLDQTHTQAIPIATMTDTLAQTLSAKKQSNLYALPMRIIEMLFAITILIITLPITLVVMIAIKLEDGGAIIYKNDRIGKNDKVFYLYKFRSMIPNAETNGAVWASTSDARITKVGRITRKLHIDEIPQMINILKGDLALVGPRPERPEIVKELAEKIPYYDVRHSIKPGFTGWAQIKFRYARSVADSQKKLEYDLFYIKNRNFFMDIGIILKTVQIIFTH